MSQRDIVNELYKPARRNFPRRKVVLKGLDDLLQLDLCDMSFMSKENDGHRYLLTGINCFSKKGFAIPMKNKTASTTTEATKILLKQSKTKFKNCQTDEGSEFKGSFEKLMKDRKINHYHTYTGLKASIVERFNRSLKNLIYKSNALRASLRYVDHLDAILETYNNRYHRTIRMPPNKVSENNEDNLLKTVYNYQRPVVNPKFSVGDYVRLVNTKYTFTNRGFYPQWSNKLYIIDAVNIKLPVTYKLRTYDKTKVLPETFYEQELQKTKNSDLFMVEKIVKRKGKKVLVRWQGFEPHDDTWEDESNLVQPEK